MKSMILAAALLIAAPAAAVRFTTTAQTAAVTDLGAGSYAFTLGGFTGGGTLIGSFTGMDDGFGQISRFCACDDSLISFSASFSGDSEVPAFSLGLDDVEAFAYTLGAVSWGGGFGPDDELEGLIAVGTREGIIFGNGPGFACDGVDACGVILSLVPEPDTWALMIVGFGVVGFTARRRSRRGAWLAS